MGKRYPTTKPAAAVTLRPPAQRTGRSSTLPPGTLSDWVLGQGKKAVLKSSWHCSGRSASMPPVDEDQDPADYQWSRGQSGRAASGPPEGSDNAELEDSSWDQQVRNVKKIIGLSDTPRLSLLETAAYTMSRRQIESRGWAGNLDVGYVIAGETLTPEQLAQSPVSKFKPEVALKIDEATKVNPSYEVHQVKWSRKALGQIGWHVQRAREWLDDNPDWHPAFVYATPKQITHELHEEFGGGSTPEAKAYAWPETKESQAQRGNVIPPRKEGGAGASAAPPPRDKITVTRADGTPYEFSASSGDEIDPVTQKAVNMPKKLMSPFMAVGSFTPVTRKDSRQVKKDAARTSYRLALSAFGAARAEIGLRRGEAIAAAIETKAAAASEAQADPLGLAATPVDRDPLDLAKWGSQSLGTAGPQLCLRSRKKRSVSLKARRRGASGTRPVALVPNQAYECRREIMKNVAGGLPAICLIPPAPMLLSATSLSSKSLPLPPSRRDTLK